MGDKNKIEFLDIIIPFSFIYTSVICFKSYFIDSTPKGSILDIVILTSISFVFMYGVIALIRDFRMFGWRWMIKSWRHIHKKISK